MPHAGAGACPAGGNPGGATADDFANGPASADAGGGVLETARLRAASAAAMPQASHAAAEAVLDAARLRAASAETTPQASPAAAEPPAARRRPPRRGPLPGPTLTGTHPPSVSASPGAPTTGAPPATSQLPCSTTMSPTNTSAAAANPPATAQPTSPAMPQGPCGRHYSSHAPCRSTTRSSTNRNSWLETRPLLASTDARDDEGCRRQIT